MIDRKELIEEQLLRENIRKAIKLVRSRKAKQEKLEEQLLRKAIRALILEKAPVGEDVPHEKTGINVLRDTLKNIIPQFGDDYMRQTTDRNQRDSYTAVFINGIDNILAPIETNIAAPEGIEDAEDEEGVETELGEEIDITIGDEDKFIDIGDMGLEDAEDEEEEEVDDDEMALTKGLAGEELDPTGRAMALDTLKQIQGTIVDDFGKLFNDEDRELYHDYIKTNILLWRDKFEDSLSKKLPEPTTPEYEKEKKHLSGEGLLEIIDL
jgi:hypothetical protein